MKAALVTSSLSRNGGGVAAVVEDLSRALLPIVSDVRVVGLRTSMAAKIRELERSACLGSCRSRSLRARICADGTLSLTRH